MDEQLPYFPLYAYQFETSQTVKAMSAEAEGLYIALLRSQWINGSVPASDEGLRAILKPHAAESLEQVKQCFPVDRSDASRRFNPKLERIRDEVMRKRDRLARAGHQGGVASGLSRRSNRQASLEASLKQGSSIASSSPVVTKKKVVQEEVKTGSQEQEQQKNLPVIFQKPWDFPTTEAVTRAKAKGARRQAITEGLTVAAGIVFDYWRAIMGHAAAKFAGERVSKVIARLRENDGDLSELLYAIDGATRDDWTMGRDPKSTKKYDGLESLMMDRGRIEKFLGLIPERNGRHPFLEGQDGVAA